MLERHACTHTGTSHLAKASLDTSHGPQKLLEDAIAQRLELAAKAVHNAAWLGQGSVGCSPSALESAPAHSPHAGQPPDPRPVLSVAKAQAWDAHSALVFGPAAAAVVLEERCCSSLGLLVCAACCCEEQGPLPADGCWEAVVGACNVFQLSRIIDGKCSRGCCWAEVHYLALAGAGGLGWVELCAWRLRAAKRSGAAVGL